MKIVIFVPLEPQIYETFLFKELAILERHKVDFHLIVSRLSPGRRQKFTIFDKYSSRFLYLPDYRSRSRFKNLRTVFSGQLKFLLSCPRLCLKTIIWLIFRFNFHWWRNYLRLSPQLLDIYRFKPDFFYSRAAGDSLISAFLSSVVFDRKFGLAYFRFRPHPALNSYLYDRIAFIMVKAGFVGQQYLEYFPQLRGKIQVIPWGIDTRFFKKENRKRKTAVYKILACGQLLEKKGYLHLLEACLLLKGKTAFQCLIIGNGPEQGKLTAFIEDNSLEKLVRILPPLPQKELKKRYEWADVFIQPSVVDLSGNRDIIPNAALEAMAMELPVITTGESGLTAVIKNKQNGFIITAADPPGTTRMLETVRKLTDQQKKELGRKARQTVVDGYHLNKQADKFIKLLNTFDS
ncbi:MAG: group 1 glycosyl transferase [Candidatus Gottesmanbacteria bacterium GW2011_GWA2_43_14]|uniref:Group 1 glycosyl transferase n=1 Tax=Candidatus Gottesmanbacteria bacterium GW2011_GWA2_43_14 TaxID=1618443 RepID=A0A0G1DLI2_9BACT|nr:MAG: group 1 glycosyl transferase [Candidatus Gottesmanbacteria bacterium GW2011_GWA2_43_14]